MLEFKTSSNAKKAKPITFKIDDEEYVAHPPKDTALMFLVASGADNDAATQMKEVLEFFRAVLDEDSMQRFVDRLRDKNDTLTLADAMKILQGLIAEFGGRPTE